MGDLYLYIYNPKILRSGDQKMCIFVDDRLPNFVQNGARFEVVTMVTMKFAVV